MDKLKPWQRALLIVGSTGLLWYGFVQAVEGAKLVVPEGQPCAGGRLMDGRNPWGVVVGSTGFDRVVFDTPMLTVVAPFMENNYQILPRDKWERGAVTSIGGKVAGRQFRVQIEDRREYCIQGKEVYYK